jgi:hypothetical protein
MYFAPFILLAVCVLLLLMVFGCFASALGGHEHGQSGSK